MSNTPTPTDIINSYIADHPAPYHGLIMDFIEYPDHMAIRLYRDNFEMFSDPQRIGFVEWLNTLFADINFMSKFVLTVEMQGGIVPNAM